MSNAGLTNIYFKKGTSEFQGLSIENDLLSLLVLEVEMNTTFKNLNMKLSFSSTGEM